MLISCGYGAGWSTWEDSKDSQTKLFCPEVVEAIERGIDKSELEPLADSLFGGYNGGADQLVIYWVKKGTAFRISEYDGSESLEILGEIEHFIA